MSLKQIVVSSIQRAQTRNGMVSDTTEDLMTDSFDELQTYLQHLTKKMN